MVAKVINFDQVVDVDGTCQDVLELTNLVNRNAVTEAVQLASFCAAAARRLEKRGHHKLADVYRGIAVELVNMLSVVDSKIPAVVASVGRAATEES